MFVWWEVVKLCLHKASRNSSPGLLMSLRAGRSTPRLLQRVDFNTAARSVRVGKRVSVSWRCTTLRHWTHGCPRPQPTLCPVCLERRGLRLQPQLQCEHTGFQINKEQITNIWTDVATNNTTGMCRCRSDTNRRVFFFFPTRSLPKKF